MNTDLIVQPIDVIRAAVDDLTAGLSRGEVISPERWDRSVTTLARCHDQVGGNTRRRVYEVFAACAEPGRDARVAAQLDSMAKWLQASR